VINEDLKLDGKRPLSNKEEGSGTKEMRKSITVNLFLNIYYNRPGVGRI
jgi:hypothetical protein